MLLQTVGDHNVKTQVPLNNIITIISKNPLTTGNEGADLATIMYLYFYIMVANCYPDCKELMFFFLN